jgi:alpha-beta hydrolase superfamily lysophospholipase
MNHQEGFFRNAQNLQIYHQSWLPEDEPTAVLMLIHGLAEHSGRYSNVVNHFVPMGYAIYSHDHIGHGKSEGTRLYVERFQDFLNPLKTYYEMIASRHPGKPIFLAGHSMGGLISATYLLDHQDSFTGAILSGPSVKAPDHISPAIITAGKFLSKVIPKFGLMQLESDGISRDPAVVQAYIRDPLVSTRKMTARLAAELLNAMNRIALEANKISLPILIVHGGSDKLVEPEGSRLFYNRIQSTDKTIRIYDGLYHVSAAT